MLRFVATLQFILLLFLFVSPGNGDETKCTIRPYEAKGEVSPGSNGYLIEVSYLKYRGRRIKEILRLMEPPLNQWIRQKDLFPEKYIKVIQYDPEFMKSKYNLLI